MSDKLTKDSRILPSRIEDDCFICVFKHADPNMRVHEHSFLEIAYIVSGKGMHEIGAELFPITTGDIFILPTGVRHRFLSSDPENPVVHYNCLLFLDSAEPVDYSLFREIASDLFYNQLFPQDVNRAPYIRLTDTTHHIIRLLEIMEAETIAERPDSRNMLFGCAVELLVRISRLYESQFGTNTVVRARRDGIMDVLSYLEKNFSKNITLNELSRIALFSPNYFCSLFKETVGCSATEYIQRIRSKEALRLLLSTDLSAQDICYKIGYSDEKFFRAVFKREFGCTPGEYRRKYKK